MARGFESKDVEFQQAEATREKARRTLSPLTDGEREAASRRQTLELSLARARSELAAARSVFRPEAVHEILRSPRHEGSGSN